MTGKPFRELLDGLSYWLAHTFSITLGVGGSLVALPVVWAILVWLIVWPMSGFEGFANKLAQMQTPEVQSSSDKFWTVWVWACLFVGLYAAVGWPLRIMRRGMGNGDDSRRPMRMPHCEVSRRQLPCPHSFMVNVLARRRCGHPRRSSCFGHTQRCEKHRHRPSGHLDTGRHSGVPRCRWSGINHDWS